MAKKCKALWVFILSLLVVLCMGLVACGDDEGGNNENPPAAVNAATVTYDGSIIKWQPVSNATSYTLTINGTQYTSYNNGQYQFPHTTVSADNYVIVIKANNSYGSSGEVTRSFQKLNAPENIQFTEEGEMSWAAVIGAASYVVEVNNVEKATDLPLFNDFSYGARNAIRVKAAGGPDTFGIWSTVLYKEYLASPTTITYDGQYLQWKGVPNAVGYTLYVDGMEYSDVSTNKYLYDSGNHDFDVEIRAEGNGQTSFPSKNSDKQEFVFLGAAENVHVDESGTLVWDKVEKATSYHVKTQINGSKSDKTVNEPKFDLREGEQTTVEIKPLANGNATYFSTYSTPQTFALLRSPVLQWNDDFALTDGNEATALTWNPPAGDIAGYNVKIAFTPADGSAKTERTASATAGNPSYSDSYLQIGTYEIQVQSLSNPGSDWSNSKYSQAITVIRLPAPKRVADDTFIVSDAKDVTKGFTVNFQGVSGASQYVLWKDGAKTNITAGKGQTAISVNQVVDATTTSEVNSHYALQAVGSVTTVGNAIVATLGSLDKDSLPIDITVAAAPSAASLDIVGGDIIWDSVTGVSQYAVNTGSGSVELTNTNGYSLRNITTVGNHEVSVCSAGDGKALLPSNYSKSFSVYKLHKPTNIKIGTSVNEGKLSWDWGDNYSQGFKVFVNGDETAIPTDAIDNMNQYVKDGGVAVVVQATGDYWNDPEKKTTYYLDSDKSDVRTFKKLAEVTFPSPFIDGTRLVWNAPTNVTSSTNVSYQVRVNGKLRNEQMDGSSMDLASLEADDYTVQIRCIGDGLTTINSEYSEVKEFRRLATPKVERTETKYVWKTVAGAVRYQVYVGDKLLDTVEQGDPLEAIPRFDDLAVQTVRVIAVGDAYNSMNSKPHEFTQQISQLPAPTFTYSYDKDYYAPNGKITMTVTTPDANASGYIFKYDASNPTSITSTTYSFDTSAADSYTMSVVAAGGKFDENGVYWADSLPSASKKAIIYGKPNVSDIEPNQDGEIEWQAVSDVNTYKLIITYTNGDTEEVTTKTSRYTPEDLDSISTITIICVGTVKANEEITAGNAYISSMSDPWTNRA